MTGSPGSHPHADRPNWSPATTVEEYLRNCQEGLETFSDRRLAKLMGVSRTWLWRCRQMGHIPEDLFERLLAERNSFAPSTKELAAIGQALAAGGLSQTIERCPHCGATLRVRSSVRPEVLAVVNEWLRGQSAGPSGTESR